jgi:tRNA U34 5-methylaminomethyl-2-thiouridine-forming methyltransferase MnmC
MAPDDESVDRPEAIESVRTRDGSFTLFDRRRDVHYSSMHGAEDESRHIFVEGTGLADRPPPWQVLELGFGAGINFVQTARAYRRVAGPSSGDLVYHSVDYAPVGPESVDFHGGEPGEMVRRALAAVSVDEPEPVAIDSDDDSIHLVLHPTPWLELDLPDLRADAVFFDPFGPKNEPDSWQAPCFEVARRHMTDEALLGTYSAASTVKRAMFRAGFAVASAPGPGPKREITYAAASNDRLRAVLDDPELLSADRYLDDDA